MWLNQKTKVWWCGASQPSLISYAACLVPPATSRLQLFNKHENVTLQWVGALPSLKHISSHSPLLLFFLSFYLSSLTQGRVEVKRSGVSNNDFFPFFLAGRGRTENRPVCRRKIGVVQLEKGSVKFRRIKPGCNVCSFYMGHWALVNVHVTQLAAKRSQLRHKIYYGIILGCFRVSG